MIDLLTAAAAAAAVMTSRHADCWQELMQVCRRTKNSIIHGMIDWSRD